MTIPANVTTELANLQAQVAAAVPLKNQPFASIKAMQLNSHNLVADVQAALVAVNTLDAWAAPVDPISIVSGFNTIVVEAIDESNLSLLRGVTGRVASNLDQLV